MVLKPILEVNKVNSKINPGILRIPDFLRDGHSLFLDVHLFLLEICETEVYLSSKGNMMRICVDRAWLLG